MYGELSRCMVVVAGELRRQRRGEESMGMVMIFLRMRGPGACNTLREPARMFPGAPQAAA